MMVLRKKTIIILTLAILIVAAGIVTNKYGRALRVNSTGNKDQTEQTGNTGTSNTNTNTTAASGYFIDARLSKDNERTALKQTLTELIDNKNTTKEARQKAENQVIDIAKRSEIEMVIENVIKSKDFDDAVVFITDTDAIITVRAKELKADQVTLIKNIACRESGLLASKITVQAKE
jgi:hypothetical protein